DGRARRTGRDLQAAGAEHPRILRRELARRGDLAAGELLDLDIVDGGGGSRGGRHRDMAIAGGHGAGLELAGQVHRLHRRTERRHRRLQTTDDALLSIEVRLLLSDRIRRGALRRYQLVDQRGGVETACESSERYSRHDRILSVTAGYY